MRKVQERQQADLDKLGVRRRDLERELTQLKTTLRIESQNAESSEKEVKDTGQALKGLQEASQAKRGEIAATQKALEGAQKTLEGAQKALEDAQAKIRTLETQSQAEAQALGALVAQERKAKRQNASAVSDWTAHRAAITQAKDAIEKLEESLSHL